jgi:hypothetical protein
MYEATTFEEKTGTSSQDLYTTKSKFHYSTSLAIVNVATIVEFSALHLLLSSATMQTCCRGGPT